MRRTDSRRARATPPRGPRTRTGFRRVGPASLGKADLPARWLRQLRVEQAWRVVAGPAVASRAGATAVRRGVLEIRVADPRWADAVAGLIPALAARMAARFPDLGVRRYRVLAGESTGPVPSLAVPPPADAEPAAASGAGAAREGQREAVAAPAPASDALDLEALAERYLRRARRRGPRDGG